MATNPVITKWKVVGAEIHNRKVKEGQNCLQKLGVKGKEAGQMIGQLDKVLGTSIGTLGKLSVATAVASGAMKVMKDAFMASEGNIDEWGRITKSSKAAYDTFVNAINSGNWDGFFSRLNDAISGGMELYDVFDKLGSTKLNNEVPIAILENKLTELRLLKQQGKDVGDQIKSVSDQLAKLKGEAVTIGKEANRQGWIDVVVNAGGNRGYAKVYWDKYKQEGQKFYKWAAKEAKKYEGYVAPSVENHYQGYYKQNTLTGNAKNRYKTLKAILDMETKLQEYQSGYANAERESGQINAESYKYNRWGQSGSGSGGKSGGKTGSGKSGATEEWAMIDYTPDFGRSQAEIESHLKIWRESYANAGDDAGRAYAQRFIDKLESELKAMTGNGSESNPLSDALKDVKIKLPEFSMEDAIKGLDKKSKNVADGWQKAAGAVGQLGSALQGLEDPGAKVAGIVAEAVANIASTFATSLKGTVTPWDWIAAAISGTATMISTISAIKSATSGSYAQGGIIPGANNGGRDNTWAYVSPGEVILNKAQQRNLAGQLNGGGQSSSGGSAYVSGEMIVMAVNAWGRRTGRGEILR